MKEKRHNGWTNYETWNYNLWLESNHGSYSYWTEEAQRHYNELEGDEAVSALADQMKDDAGAFAEENMPSQSDWMADAINCYLSEVDFYEIAERYLSDIEEEEEENE
jgi:hypothetical protein